MKLHSGSGGAAGEYGAAGAVFIRTGRRRTWLDVAQWISIDTIQQIWKLLEDFNFAMSNRARVLQSTLALKV